MTGGLVKKSFQQTAVAVAKFIQFNKGVVLLINMKENKCPQCGSMNVAKILYRILRTWLYCIVHNLLKVHRFGPDFV